MKCGGFRKTNLIARNGNAYVFNVVFWCKSRHTKISSVLFTKGTNETTKQ